MQKFCQTEGLFVQCILLILEDIQFETKKNSSPLYLPNSHRSRLTGTTLRATWSLNPVLTMTFLEMCRWLTLRLFFTTAYGCQISKFLTSYNVTIFLPDK
jgi:hypothetical protein